MGAGYELLHPIAIGGMAELYLARSTGAGGFEKQLVIKRILPEHARDPEFVEMFLNEARIAATLQHTNVVHVYDFGCEGGSYFLAMEFLDGLDVRRILQALHQQNRPIPLEIAVAVVMGVAAGLHYVHEKSDADGKPLALVHRDVSPQNIIVTRDGGVKLVDFGIAKATLRASETRAGALKGKLSYMSPEQCRLEPLDRRSDVFSLGIVLWELSVDRRLFRAKHDAAVVNAVSAVNVPRPSSFRHDYPPELERIVMKALAADREQRYRTAEAMLIELEAFAAERKLSTSPRAIATFMRELEVEPEPRAAPGRTRVFGTSDRRDRRRRGIARAIVAAGVVAAGIAAALVLPRRSTSRPEVTVAASRPVVAEPARPPAPPPVAAPDDARQGPATPLTVAPDRPLRGHPTHKRREKARSTRTETRWDPNSALLPP
jgi:serine/threonine protein kinase